MELMKKTPLLVHLRSTTSASDIDYKSMLPSATDYKSTGGGGGKGKKKKKGKAAKETGPEPTINRIVGTKVGTNSATSLKPTPKKPTQNIPRPTIKLPETRITQPSTPATPPIPSAQLPKAHVAKPKTTPAHSNAAAPVAPMKIMSRPKQPAVQQQQPQPTAPPAKPEQPKRVFRSIASTKASSTTPKPANSSRPSQHDDIW